MEVKDWLNFIAPIIIALIGNVFSHYKTKKDYHKKIEEIEKNYELKMRELQKGSELKINEMKAYMDSQAKLYESQKQTDITADLFKYVLSDKKALQEIIKLTK